MTGDGFSDIDLDDIADEDFTKGAEKVGDGLVKDKLTSAITGPSTAGKYTTSHSKNIAASLETMNKTTSNKAKHSNHQNLQTEAHVVKETMKEIMQKKGSKCKCPNQQQNNMCEK